MCGPSVPANGSSSLFSFENIYRNYLNCRRNKRNTANALRFEFNAAANLLTLERELNSKQYHPSRSILFCTTKPKVREIFAADFRDRIVHHILVEQLEKIFEPIFIHDSYACRMEKGTHAAVKRLQKFTRQATKNGKVRAYFLQLDIKDFFPSINKEILFQLIAHKVQDPDVLWLTRVVLFWDCTKSHVVRGDVSMLKRVPAHKSLFGKNNECGLPIGNLTSQFFANVYLNELDQVVKHNLKARHYLRYVDDFVVVHTDPEQLARWRDEIEAFVSARLNLKLHPVRRKLLLISNGIDFLGYIIRPGYILVRRRVLNNLKAKLRAFTHGVIDTRAVKDTIASYLGHFKHANCFRLKAKLQIN